MGNINKVDCDKLENLLAIFKNNAGIIINSLEEYVRVINDNANSCNYNDYSLISIKNSLYKINNIKEEFKDSSKTIINGLEKTIADSLKQEREASLLFGSLNAHKEEYKD